MKKDFSTRKIKIEDNYKLPFNHFMSGCIYVSHILKFFKIVLTKAKMIQIYSTCYIIWRSKIYEYRRAKDKHKWNYTTVRFGHYCQIV